MLARVTVKINPDVVIGNLQPLFAAKGLNITRFWHEDDLIILHVDTKVRAKVKLKVLSYRETFVCLKIKDVIVEGFFKIPGGLTGVIMNAFKGMIEKDFPYAKLKVDGNILWFENLLSKD